MWNSIAAFFSRSETIFWARLNALVGLIAAAMSLVDPALLQAVMTPRNFAIYMVINGVVTELARRIRAPDLGKPK